MPHARRIAGSRRRNLSISPMRLSMMHDGIFDGTMLALSGASSLRTPCYLLLSGFTPRAISISSRPLTRAERKASTGRYTHACRRE